MNPGEELRDYIPVMYPVGKGSAAERMDSDLQGDGELSSLIHSSLINYLVRRLVVTAEYRRRTYPDEWKTRLRKYLREDRSTEVHDHWSAEVTYPQKCHRFVTRLSANR
jgi:hypothetical protein